MILPFPVCLKSRIQTRKKLILVGLFGLGIFITIIQIIRFQTIKRLSNYVDSAPLILWSAVENNLGIIVANVPTLAPLVKYYSERASCGGGGGGSSSGDNNINARRTAGAMSPPSGGRALYTVGGSCMSGATTAASSAAAAAAAPPGKGGGGRRGSLGSRLRGTCAGAKSSGNWPSPAAPKGVDTLAGSSVHVDNATELGCFDGGGGGGGSGVVSCGLSVGGNGNGSTVSISLDRCNVSDEGGSGSADGGGNGMRPSTAGITKKVEITITRS